jgi:hypothetical protein
MPEPGSFEDLERNVPPDVKHRYTQWRAMQRQRDLSPTRDPEVLRKRGEESRALMSMFARPGSNDGNLFEMMGESETDTQAESEHPLGAQYGSDYASHSAAMQRNPIRLSPATQKRVESSPTAYADGNSRYVGISERTFLAPPNNNRAKAAKALLKIGK